MKRGVFFFFFFFFFFFCFFFLICGLCTVCLGLFVLLLGVIGRLCSMIVIIPGHRLYYLSESDYIQSTLVIAKSKGLTEMLRDQKTYLDISDLQD